MIHLARSADSDQDVKPSASGKAEVVDEAPSLPDGPIAGFVNAPNDNTDPVFWKDFVEAPIQIQNLNRELRDVQTQREIKFGSDIE